jgi:hypothetical protein
MKISLKDQVSTLEGVLVNHRSYVSVCERYAQEGNFNKEVLEDTKSRLPYMEACLVTMKWLLANEEKVKAALKNKT